MTRKMICAAIAGLVLASGATPLMAGETGIASIHAWVRVGNKTCIANHWHFGNATAATKQQAEKTAINNWIVYTMYDYGSDWMHFRLGESKAVKCEKVVEGWACQAEARACKMTKSTSKAPAAKAKPKV